LERGVVILKIGMRVELYAFEDPQNHYPDFQNGDVLVIIAIDFATGDEFAYQCAKGKSNPGKDTWFKERELRPYLAHLFQEDI